MSTPEKTDYEIVTDAIEDTLSEFIHEDDIAEPAIYADAIENAAGMIANLRRALASLVDDDECAFDHHGNCQTHHLDNPCSVRLARELLAASRVPQQEKPE